MWNRIAALMVLVVTTSLLILPFEAEARGGGRGGGGGGGGRAGGGGGRAGGGANKGGSYSGGRTMNRTPTMSRASGRPAASQSISQTRQQLPARTNVSQGRAQQARQTNQQGLSTQRGRQKPTAANRAELRDQVNKYAQGGQVQNINRQDLAQKTKNFSSNRSGQSAQNRQLSNNVSQRLQQSRPDSNQWFNRNFFDNHNLDVNYGTGANLWRPAAWASLAAWGAWNWSTPYYYDDGGYAYPITTDESTYSYPTTTTVYPGNTTPTQQPVQTQSDQGIQTTATQGDWLPLGVFAVASDANAATQTNHFIQLAVNRSGEISGVLFNSATDVAQDIIGTVNNETQKAYWSLANKPGAPVASTGIYNLTEDQTPINVHFSDGSDQTWTLVRIQQGQ